MKKGIKTLKRIFVVFLAVAMVMNTINLPRKEFFLRRKKRYRIAPKRIQRVILCLSMR